MSNQAVGILALQGDFDLHCQMIERIGAKAILVRSAGDLQCVDRLIIPGGESTTMLLLIDSFKLRDPLLEFGRRRPVWGTCAGLIILSKGVEDSEVETLQLIDISVVRNAYGRQINSFVDEGSVSLGATERPFQMVFIRAPKIAGFGSQVRPIARCRGEITGAVQGSVLVTAFHPELTDDTSFHEFFLSLSVV